MSEHTPDPVDHHPPLDDRERGLLLYLAVVTIAVQTGDTEQATAQVLDELAGEGLVCIYRNEVGAYLTVRDDDGEDRVIVAAARDWLHFMAHRPDPAMN